jgi:hypothetical protein
MAATQRIHVQPEETTVPYPVPALISHNIVRQSTSHTLFYPFQNVWQVWVTYDYWALVLTILTLISQDHLCMLEIKEQTCKEMM